jgi:glycerol-3-phosphate dehydrogenase
VAGCELGGAIKNVIALTVGLAAGLDMGDNARALLVTRGVAETARLGQPMGADPLVSMKAKTSARAVARSGQVRVPICSLSRAQEISRQR